MLELLQAAREFQQISEFEGRTTRADDERGILGLQAGPTDRQNPQAARVVVVVHLISAPVVARGDQLKCLSEEWMKGVGNLESSFVRV